MLILRAKQRILRGAAEIKRDLLFSIGGKVYAQHCPGGVRVLIYHGVVPSNPFRFNSRFVSEDLFANHLQLLATNCNLVGLDDLKNGNTAPDRLNVLLTFDDGYQNNFQSAFPILKRYKAPAVFFITSGRGDQWLFNDVMDVFPSVGPPEVLLNGKKFFRKRKGVHFRYLDKEGKSAAEVFYSLNGTERELVLEQVFSIVSRERFDPCRRYLDLLNEGEIKEINNTRGYSIGAHGSTHADLSLLSPLDLAHELHQVQSQLKALLGKPCTTLAFPYGRYNAGVIKAGTDAGFMDFFGTEFRNGNESKVRPRLTVNPYVSAANELFYISKGSHE
jgi:peptidoglycan/xylan/chitin deacetylase (PgdA/CDA1 family)